METVERYERPRQTTGMLDLARRRVLAALTVMLAGLRVRRAEALPSYALTPEQIRALVEAAKAEPPPAALRGGCVIGGTGRPAAQGLPSLFGPMNGKQASGREVSAEKASGAPVDSDMPAAARWRRS